MGCGGRISGTAVGANYLDYPRPDAGKRGENRQVADNHSIRHVHFVSDGHFVSFPVGKNAPIS